MASALATLDYLSLVIAAHPDELTLIDQYAKVESYVAKLEATNATRLRALERAQSLTK